MSVQIADEMHDAIVKLAGDREVYDSRERWLQRAARRAGISFRTAKALFYREVPDPRASVIEKIRTAVRGNGDEPQLGAYAALQTQIDKLQVDVDEAREILRGIRDRADRGLASVHRAVSNERRRRNPPKG